MLKVLASASVAAALIGGAAGASVIDFETLPGGGMPSEGPIASPLTYALGTNQLSFSSTVGLGIAEVGGSPPFGFFPEDTPDPATAFGQFFLTTQLAETSDLTVSYLNPVTGFNFDLGDVDGRQDDPSGGTQVETFTIEVRDTSNAVLDTIVVTGDTPGAGDQSVYNVSYSSGSANIGSIFIEATVPSTRKIGIAFDNFDPDSPTPVPLPHTLPLLMAGFGAFAFVRRRKRAA